MAETEGQIIPRGTTPEGDVMTTVELSGRCLAHLELIRKHISLEISLDEAIAVAAAHFVDQVVDQPVGGKP